MQSRSSIEPGCGASSTCKLPSVLHWTPTVCSSPSSATCLAACHPAHLQGAARLLLRVADSISSFPKHVVPILTSTVIECHRAELHASAYKWAAVLAQPQHLGQVAEPYRKKIESLARTPAW